MKLNWQQAMQQCKIAYPQRHITHISLLILRLEKFLTVAAAAKESTTALIKRASQKCLSRQVKMSNELPVQPQHFV